MITRVFLRTSSCGPMGSFLGDREYDVPGEVPRELAEGWVAGGFALVRAETPNTTTSMEAAVAFTDMVETAAVRTEAPKRRGRPPKAK